MKNPIRFKTEAGEYLHLVQGYVQNVVDRKSYNSVSFKIDSTKPISRERGVCRPQGRDTNYCISTASGDCGANDNTAHGGRKWPRGATGDFEGGNGTICWLLCWGQYSRRYCWCLCPKDCGIKGRLWLVSSVWPRTSRTVYGDRQKRDRTGLRTFCPKLLHYFIATQAAIKESK